MMKFYVDKGDTAEDTTADTTTENTAKEEIALNVGRTYIALVPSSNQSKTVVK